MDPEGQGMGDPTLAATQKQDADHLSLLVICWKVYAALAACGGCFGLIYVVLGSVVATSTATAKAGEGVVIGGAFAIVGIAIMAVTCSLGALFWLVSMRMAERKGLTLCTVMAAIVCINIPLGTALGVFSLIVLNRPSVKALFD